MELRHLRYFQAVAEEGHITRAAERLGIQQPPLSQQIRLLEAELGVLLFRRKPRGVELTDAGQALLEDTRAILASVDGARARARRTARGEEGTVVVGFTSSAPFHPFVPAVIRTFRETYPNVSLMLEESGTGALVDGLRREQIDAAFVRSPVADRQGLAVHALFEEPMLVALPAGHRLAGDEATPIALSEIAAEPLILYRRRSGPGLYDAIIGACRAAGFSPNIAQEAPRIVSTLNLVAAGIGVSLVPESLGALGMAGIAYRRLERRPKLIAPLTLASRAVSHSAAVANFVGMVRRAGRTHRGGATAGRPDATA
jgi:DNA-binding transcriptional LysR family regulator